MLNPAQRAEGSRGCLEQQFAGVLVLQLNHPDQLCGLYLIRTMRKCVPMLSKVRQLSEIHRVHKRNGPFLSLSFQIDSYLYIMLKCLDRTNLYTVRMFCRHISPCTDTGRSGGRTRHSGCRTCCTRRAAAGWRGNKQYVEPRRLISA